MSFLTGIDRNVRLLALCQALFMTTTSAVITSAALVGHLLAADKALATLPIAFQFVATMLIAIPASYYMRRFGRRVGFITGAGIGAVGGAVAATAIFAGSFWLFVAGSMLIGTFNGFAQFFRFAAADATDVAVRGRAISLVLAGGLVAAVTGPSLARLTTGMFDPVTFAGTFAAIVVIYLAIGLVVAFLDIPPPGEHEQRGRQRPLGEILRQRNAAVAICGAVASYVVMSFLMTVTPLAMAVCGFGFGDSASVIQAHIIGMFLPSFFTGHLITRYGATNVMLAGAALQATCVAVNLAGVDFANFLAAMMLVGVGWNFLFIGATTLLTECYVPAEKAKIQGVNDFCVWGSVAFAGLLSGASQQLFGWALMNVFVLPLIALVFAGVVWLKLAPSRPRLAA